jgi:hypothetical protein
MGNTAIALHTDTSPLAINKACGIPAVLTPPESRSVLEDEFNTSLGPVKALPAYTGTALTVLPA